MKLEDVKHIAVIGGGVMGGGIAQIHAAAGYRVTIRDLTDQIIEETRYELHDGKWGVKRAVERGKMGFDMAQQVIDNVDFSTELADLANVDLIIEAVPEKLELKQSVFEELDKAIKPEAIFASNTSGFVIQEIAEKVSADRKTRFIGLHYSNPVPVMTMVEIITTPDTTEEVTETAIGISRAARRDISMVKDAPGTYGFILNRVFAAAYREAKKIVDDGLASPEDVDRAMITGRNWPAGFFGGRGGIGKHW